MLEQFIEQQLARPFAWGAADCSLALADWLVAKGYPDVAHDLRGTYSTEDECRALIARHGGLVPLVTLCAERAGLVPIGAPELGAVAVVGAHKRRDRQWGAIWNGGKWLARWDNQFVGFAARPLAMWRV